MLLLYTIKNLSLYFLLNFFNKVSHLISSLFLHI
nr:MAG TPA: hypothetical protein [Caudoviricetes sp.]